MDLTGDRSHKITSRHLRRQAYLYIRQSTLRQVVENTESTERQYALRQRAVALGWPIEQVVVIDRDLGQSGASAADREGFQQLVRDVGLGRAGLVMGLEVSRLARNSTDWHRLLEICACGCSRIRASRAPFFFGRSRQRRRDTGLVIERLPREEWTALIPDAHPGYITWEAFEENQRRLRENVQAVGGDRRRSPPREGPALLQGLAVCGRCGDRMTVRYHRRQGALWPTYVCQRRGIARAEPICQSIPGRGLDTAIGCVLIEAVTPLTLEMTLTVQHELQARLEETDRLH
jgi:hypothetical protein